MRIRAARAAEVPRLRDIDWDAGLVFRDIGMPEAAEFEPRSLEELAESQQAGGLWVAAGEDDAAASFLMTIPVDGCLHVEQLSTDPASARQGLGRVLLDHAADRAQADGVPAMTLTTFADVPWNAPYYARCGFRVLRDDELGPGLRAIRAHEIALGLDQWPRVCMRRDLTPLSPLHPAPNAQRAAPCPGVRLGPASRTTCTARTTAPVRIQDSSH